MALTQIGKEGITGISNSANANAITIDSGENVALSGTLGVTGAVTANAGVVVDNITIDGTEIDLSSGSLTIDVAGALNLDTDAGGIYFKDGGTTIGEFINSSSDFMLKSAVQDKDILFKGNDGGSTITALTLDMSAGGNAIFNNSIAVADGDASAPGFRFKDDLNNGMFRAGTDIIGLSTAGAERVRIDASGQVGIGITPTVQFQVEESSTGDAVKIARGGNYILIGGSGSGVQYVKGYEGSVAFGNVYAGNTTFLTSNSERMRINAAGNVGLGTTSPEGKLTLGVNTTSSDGLYINNAASGGGELDLVSLGTSYAAHGAGAGEVWLYSPDNINIGGATGGTNSVKILGNGATRMKVHADGNIDMPNRAFAEGHFSGSNTTNNTGWAMTVTASNFMTYQNNATHGHGLTVQKAGYYIMFGSSLYDPTGNYIYIGWCINGGQLHHWHSNHVVESNHDFVSSAMHYCNVGDHITMENSSASLQATWGGNHSVFWVLKVT